MLRLKNLGSGSAGNATLIEGSDGLHTRRLLVDCGLGVRQLAARLDQAGLDRWLARFEAVDSTDFPETERLNRALMIGQLRDTLEGMALRLNLMPLVLPSVIIQQGISVFGFFCFGLAAVKAGTIDQPMAPIWRRSRRMFLPIGIGGSALGTWILLQANSSVDSTFIFGSSVIMGFSAFSALGYVGLIAAVSGGVAG